VVVATVFNPFLPEARRDPYPHYAACRREAPVHWSPIVQAFVLTRYDDVLRVLRDPSFSVDRTKLPLFRGPVNPLDFLGEHLKTLFLNLMLFQDPPRHTRLRNLVGKAFTPRTVAGLHERIDAIVEERLDAAADAGRMELVEDLANPVPVTVIAELLGVPAADRPRFNAWAGAVTSLLEPAAVLDAGFRERANRALAEMRAYLDDVVAARRRTPRDDLLTRLAEAEEAGSRLDADELFAMAVLLLIAGHETTANLIGNAVLALLRHPGERKRLTEDPDLLASAVEEFLRYDTVAQLTARLATEPVEIDGVAIAPRQPVLLVIGAANRDPARFEDPDRLDLGRADNRHLAFGFGQHFCLGASLARAEARATLGALLRRFPAFDGDPDAAEHKPTGLLRGLRALPLALD
jgi:cytochrome P450